MATTIVQAERVQILVDSEPVDGRYVLYWMHSAVRGEFNHALEYAVQQANSVDLPLLVAFGLWAGYPDANLRHFRFLLEGLQDVAGYLKRRNIGFVVQLGHPLDVAMRLAQEAALLVIDRNYLRHHRHWYQQLVSALDRRLIQVETDVVVPVETASAKREYAARTLRPKINRHLDDFLIELKTTPLDNPEENPAGGVDLDDIEGVLDSLNLDGDVQPVSHLFRGGTIQARRTLQSFLENRFGDYAAHRNQPQTNDVSYMSMYLHYGHISPVYVALQIQRSGGSSENIASFIEELVVRRELPMNFVFYEDDYDRFEALPDWSKKTLNEHADDPRPHCYTRAELESAETHDEYWNAAMREMRFSGYMHNYMRMYWGKKILEWSRSPQQAHQTLLYLNNKYFLDGRDANSFSNALWVFGLHDRPWKERDIFGKVRFMSQAGLKRKADMNAYVKKVDRIADQSRQAWQE